MCQFPPVLTFCCGSLFSIYCDILSWYPASFLAFSLPFYPVFLVMFYVASIMFFFQHLFWHSIWHPSPVFCFDVRFGLAFQAGVLEPRLLLLLVTRGLGGPDTWHIVIFCACVSYIDVVLHEDVVHFVLVTWRCSTRSFMVHLRWSDIGVDILGVDILGVGWVGFGGGGGCVITFLTVRSSWFIFIEVT